ncbi:MAG: VOC family protein [Clostridium sp.]|uniref:VOC family protein n=1 Tax=Clostridium sp. TaxID=1506 RepID=UPI0039EA0624
MGTSKKPLFSYMDCIELYTPDIQRGIEYYCNSLGLKVLWKSDSVAGLGMSEGITEIVIQNERKEQNIDIKVDSVIEAVKEIEKAGGQIIYGPFDIRIGKCAVVKDPWNNKYVILDTTKGTYITDNEGNIIGQNKPSNNII